MTARAKKQPRRAKVSRDAELGRWFRARVKRRKARRKMEEAGRKAARQGRK